MFNRRERKERRENLVFWNSQSNALRSGRGATALRLFCRNFIWISSVFICG